MNRRELIAATSAGILAHAIQVFSQNTVRYVCPPCGCRLDGEVFDEPGSCPACGMTLIDSSSLGEVTAIPNFLKLNDQVWTGGQPRPEHVPKLKEEGARVIIDLRPRPESREIGDREEALADEVALEYFNIPVRWRNPQFADADEFLRITDEQLGNGPVFIHCQAAVRVGGFWMIRRVLRDGWDFDQALEEANRIGLGGEQHLIDFATEYIQANTP